MAYDSSAGGPSFAEGGYGALRLLAYLTVAVMLMVADHRGGYLTQVRTWLTALNEPLYRAAALPVVALRSLRDSVISRGVLVDERDRLNAEMLVARAQLARMDELQRENTRLRELMGSSRGLAMRVQLAHLADLDLDPFRHRIVLDQGSRQGVREGLAIIDAKGLVGQIVAVAPLRATGMLISDASHAVPVQVQRSGLRTIAYGTGEVDRLVVPNIPQSADVREGDLLLTSGMGGGFPAGLQVARIVRLLPDDTRLFVVAEAEPVAALDRSGEVLLVWVPEPELDVGPPHASQTTEDAPVDGAPSP
ncbi:MAG: rod shape-determining protein MreC [Lysobacteraceae bacterium]